MCMVPGPRTDVNDGRMGVMTCTDVKGCAEEHGHGKDCEEDEVTIVEVREGREWNG